MKKFFNYLPLTALMLGLGLTLTMSAFKAETKTNYRANTQQWYVLDPTSDTDYEDQDITGFSGIPAPTSETECAQAGNVGDFCAILLEFPNEDPAPDLENTTVEQAITNGAEIVEAQATDGYALLPE